MGLFSLLVGPEMKTCSRCTQNFPCTSTYFQRDGKTPTGLRAQCKDCANVARRDADKTKRREKKPVLPLMEKSPEMKKVTMKSKPVKVKIVEAEETENTSVNTPESDTVIGIGKVAHNPLDLGELVRQIHMKHNAHFSISCPRQGDLRLQVHSEQVKTFKAPDLLTLFTQALS